MNPSTMNPFRVVIRDHNRDTTEVWSRHETRLGAVRECRKVNRQLEKGKIAKSALVTHD